MIKESGKAQVKAYRRGCHWRWPPLMTRNRTFLNVVELTVQAVLTGSRDHVYQGPAGFAYSSEPLAGSTATGSGCSPMGAFALGGVEVLEMLQRPVRFWWS